MFARRPAAGLGPAGLCPVCKVAAGHASDSRRPGRARIRRPALAAAGYGSQLTSRRLCVSAAESLSARRDAERRLGAQARTWLLIKNPSQNIPLGTPCKGGLERSERGLWLWRPGPGYGRRARSGRILSGRLGRARPQSVRLRQTIPASGAARAGSVTPLPERGDRAAVWRSWVGARSARGTAAWLNSTRAVRFVRPGEPGRIPVLR